LKPANILIDTGNLEHSFIYHYFIFHEGIYKIADFGFAKMV